MKVVFADRSDATRKLCNSRAHCNDTCGTPGIETESEIRSSRINGTQGAVGDHNVTVVDMASLRTVAKVGPVKYPDGLAYAPDSKRIFVSDEHGDADAVIDTRTNSLVTTIPLGGGAGNTVYEVGHEVGEKCA